MSFKNLIKKIALVAGSVALLATAGGAVSANASSYKPATSAMNKADVTNGHYFGTAPGGQTGPSKVDKNMSQERPSIFTYNNHRYEMADNGDVAKDLGPVSTSNNNSASEDDSGNANDYQAGNTNNGKLVQTSENNGAEYTAVAGAILAVSAVAFAGYDLRKNN